MAWPAATPTATYDKTATTFDRSVDPKLWAALMAKSPLLDRVPRFSIDNFKFEWEVANEPTRTYVLAGSTSGIEDSPYTTTVAATFTSGGDIEEGTLLKNITRATPIGTFQQDEVLEVTSNDGSGVCVVQRNANNVVGGTANTGYNGHTIGDSFAIIHVAKEEGSSPDRNKYRDVSLVSNYTNIVDFYLTVTGSQAATKRLVGGDTLQAQMELCLAQLQNELEGMLLYGCLNAGANAGSDSYVRRTEGLDQFVCATGGNVDYETLSVTEEALNAQVAAIVEDKSDPTDDYIIVCHPQNARVISSFGSDKVVTTPEKTKWGRYIDTFRSDLGIDLDVLWTLNCSKSDLFIIDMNKIGFAVFRPFQTATWTYGDDGVDAWRRRYLGEVGVKVVDPLYSHAKLGKLTW